MGNFNKGFGGGKKFGGGGFGGRDERPTMHPATCSDCGKPCEVPFFPKPGKPVFCRDCFQHEGNAPKFEKRDFGKRDFGDRKFGNRDSGKGPFGRPSFEDRKMFEATCAECGERCEVPFKPTGEKPIYCSQCFKGVKGDGNFSSPRHEGPSGGSDQMAQLNIKLDKIIRALAILTDKKSFTVDKPESKPVAKVEPKAVVEAKVEKPVAKKAGKPAKKAAEAAELKEEAPKAEKAKTAKSKKSKAK